MTSPRSPEAELNFDHKPPKSNLGTLNYDSSDFPRKGNGCCFFHLFICLIIYMFVRMT